MTPSEPSWALVVPVKRLAVAKTRLDVDPATRAELALAMAVDTVTACLRSREVVGVVVVTDEPRAAEVMRAAGASVVDDEPDAGLNPALVHGAAVAARLHPGSGVGALSSDLPALTPAALDDTLRAARAVPAGCVADAVGTGTTLLTARSADGFSPSFGTGSWQRHVDAGANDLTATADPRLRRDVDTLDDLSEALRLGCGPATTAASAAVQGTALQ